MAVLETIRVKLGVLITVLIAVALLSFLIDPNSLASVFQAKQQEVYVGTINGKNISYQDYQERLALETEMNEGNFQRYPEEYKMNILHNKTWQYFLVKNLFTPKAQEMGITVTDQEVNDALLVNLGTEVIQNFADAMNSDDANVAARAKAQWNYITEGINSELYMMKLSAMYAMTSYADSSFVDAAANTAAMYADVKYVKVPYPAEDETVTISDEQISAYYNAHQNMFKQDERGDIIYVAFESAFDEDDKDMKAAAAAQKEAGEFASAAAGSVETFKEAAAKSGKIIAEATLYRGTTALSANLSDKSKKIAKWANDASVGNVSEVIAIDGSVYVVAAVVAKHNKGVATEAEVHDTIKDLLYTQALQNNTLASVKKTVEGCKTMKDVAKALSVKVQSENNVAFNNNVMDNAFLGAVAGVAEKTVSVPVKGQDGVYVVYVESRKAENVEAQKMEAQAMMRAYAQETAQAYLQALVEKNSVNNVENYF